MISFNQILACPVCGTNIPFDTRELLLGKKFQCPKCDASIGLANESKPLVQEVLEKLDNINKGVSKPDTSKKMIFNDLFPVSTSLDKE